MPAPSLRVKSEFQGDNGGNLPYLQITSIVLPYFRLPYFRFWFFMIEWEGATFHNEIRLWLDEPAFCIIMLRQRKNFGLVTYGNAHSGIPAFAYTA